MSGSSNDAEPNGQWISGYSQVVCVHGDGQETVLRPCVSDGDAKVYLRSFNRCSEPAGRKAERRPLLLPCLARNLHGDA